MKKNVGTKDANIRTFAAAVLIIGVFFLIDNPYVKIVIAIVAAVLAGTAFLRTCPLYHFMHKNTCETTNAEVSPTPPATPAPNSDPQTSEEHTA